MRIVDSHAHPRARRRGRQRLSHAANKLNKLTVMRVRRTHPRGERTERQRARRRSAPPNEFHIPAPPPPKAPHARLDSYRRPPPQKREFPRSLHPIGRPRWSASPPSGLSMATSNAPTKRRPQFCEVVAEADAAHDVLW